MLVRFLGALLRLHLMHSDDAGNTCSRSPEIEPYLEASSNIGFEALANPMILFERGTRKVGVNVYYECEVGYLPPWLGQKGCPYG